MSAVQPQNVKSKNNVIAAFDIGSNTIKMTLAKQTLDGIAEFGWRSETVRLGQGVDTAGALAPDRIEAGLDALRRFSDFAKQQGAGRLIGVATEATRIASNGQAFLDRVTVETGIELTAISGAREAELTFLGLDGVVDLDGNVLIADIGGGSTEIILAAHREVRYAKSFAIGSGRLTEQFVHGDPPSDDELAACRSFAEAVLVETPFQCIGQSRLLITGGTGEHSFRLIPEGKNVDSDAIDELMRTLTTVTSEEIAGGLGIPIARAKVLPAGVAVVQAVVGLVNPSAIQAAQSGIRRGLLLAAFAGTI